MPSIFWRCAVPIVALARDAAGGVLDQEGEGGRVDHAAVQLLVVLALKVDHRGARRGAELAVGGDREQALHVVDRGALLAFVERGGAALDRFERRGRGPLAVGRSRGAAGCGAAVGACVGGRVGTACRRCATGVRCVVRTGGGLCGRLGLQGCEGPGPDDPVDDQVVFALEPLDGTQRVIAEDAVGGHV
jgi:hypothetical protein